MSSYQTPGRGYRPLSPNAGGDLDAVRELYTGVTLRRYVQPLGGGFHLVRRDCNDDPYEVSSSTGATYREGETVAVVGEAGLRGEIIIGPAATATADYPTVALGLRLDLNIPTPAPACPTSRTGRSYLGVYNDAVNEILYGYIYTDGVYQSTLGTYDYSGDGLSIETDPHFQRAHASGDVVVFFSSAGAGWQICTWHVAAGALDVLQVDPSAFAGPIVSGSSIYFSSASAPFLQLYKVALGASGTWDEVASREGTAYEDLAGLLFVPDNLCQSGAGRFEAPAFWFDTSTEVRIPYFASGAWTLGAAREVLAGADDPGTGNDGYAISGNRALRITYFPGGTPAALGVIPAGPGSPETSLLPSDWVPSQLQGLAISPGGTEFAVFYDSPSALLRLGVADNFGGTGCAVPTIEVEPSPDGFVPAYMLCRDH